MKGKRRSLGEIKKLITDKDGVFINEHVKNKIRFVTIRCNKDDNIWTAELSAVINKGQWCKNCHNRDRIKPVDIEKIKSFLDSKGFDLLTNPPITYWSKIEIHCPKHDRTWTTSYGGLERGSNCKFCGHGAIEFDELNKLVEKNNATFVKRIKTTKSVMNLVLKCDIHNHEWRTNATDLKKGERLCIKCRKEARKTSYEKIKEAVEDKGGTLLSTNCRGSLTPINVKCKNNHEWKTKYDYINQGYWCPECAYKTQPLLHEIIKELFPGHKTHYNYHGFKWLKSNKKFKQRMQVDIWVPKIKLAIEYDGIQHFMPVKFSSKITDEQMKKDFQDLQRRDHKKTKLIAGHPDIVKHFIRFNYKDQIDRESVISILKTHGVII